MYYLHSRLMFVALNKTGCASLLPGKRPRLCAPSCTSAKLMFPPTARTSHAEKKRPGASPGPTPTLSARHALPSGEESLAGLGILLGTADTRRLCVPGRRGTGPTGYSGNDRVAFYHRPFWLAVPVHHHRFSAVLYRYRAQRLRPYSTRGGWRGSGVFLYHLAGYDLLGRDGRGARILGRGRADDSLQRAAAGYGRIANTGIGAPWHAVFPVPLGLSPVGNFRHRRACHCLRAFSSPAS